MFGYDMDRFPGRGALEALGAGVPLDNGEVGLLAHFVSIAAAADGTLVLEDAKPKATDDEILALIETVGTYTIGDIHFRLHHTAGFRGILCLSGRVSRYVTDSDPMEKGRPLVAVAPWADYTDDPVTRNTAHALQSYMAWVYHTLGDHPANHVRRKAGQRPLNGLVFQRAGQLKPVEPFHRQYGLRGLSIASGIVHRGLATYLGMDVHKAVDTPEPGDGVRQYDEISAASGALGFVRGKELIYLILNHLDRAKLQGLMDTPWDQPYHPGAYDPFRVQMKE